jgi:ferric-dicitrate binding protein FerR (iron transport regulator)
VTAKVAPSQGAALRRPDARPAPESRRRRPWVWEAAAGMVVALGLALYWGLTAADRKPATIETKSPVDLAELAVGVYHGNVVSNA